MWFMTHNGNKDVVDDRKTIKFAPEIIENKSEAKPVLKTKSIPLIVKDACGALQVFTEKPLVKGKKTKKENKENMEPENNTLTAIGITTFLIILILNAVLDVLKAKEEERARMKLNPDGGRRHSLAEFANKKTLRRESSKFSLQLFQISETAVSDDKGGSKNATRRVPYKRGESINSYLSDKKGPGESSAPASVDTPVSEANPIKRQSVAKLFGGRPVPMVRRSSFPVLPLNPEIQALMLSSRQASFDSDDEGNKKRRRVRILRRY
ncbi:hypothetical protein RR46_05482 [Papilio xuthus]|uniref:Uncharacterized protein n=1 Tax=Papilio xuthus TaxID=66420 RepID=A0A194Q1U5_PAPXU|nr:hypothetical protein RR46_05482 [Papilio xuthus]